MGVQVLSPHNCLKDSLSPHQALMNSNRNPNPNRVRTSPQADRKKRRPTRPPAPVQKPAAPKNIVMGQVKILKRGEEIPKATPVRSPPKQNPKPQVPDLGSTSRIGPDPNKVPVLPKPAKLPEPNWASGFYAGSSSCIAAPPPESLPLPSFFAKKSAPSSTDEAASVLLKLLRLNLS
ncbi:PREDICTED: protein TonB-like [Prunus mume]|uniref:Protein TonB-like n=1 Tax=Prunus mume TaxID=102107 RepID=A0ABM0N4T8_PRUMU|nr:PREDICTED: protein TonB-like [Prunus mume]